MTYKEFMVEKRRARRRRMKEVEKILHPNLKLGDVDILHRHLPTGEVEFTAWRGDSRISDNRSLVFDKSYIAVSESPEMFYQGEIEKWVYLITGLPV